MFSMFAVSGFLKKDHKTKRIKGGSPNPSVSKTGPERIKLTLQEQRLKCAEFERKPNKMRGAAIAEPGTLQNRYYK